MLKFSVSVWVSAECAAVWLRAVTPTSNFCPVTTSNPFFQCKIVTFVWTLMRLFTSHPPQPTPHPTTHTHTHTHTVTTTRCVRSSAVGQATSHRHACTLPLRHAQAGIPCAMGNVKLSELAPLMRAVARSGRRAVQSFKHVNSDTTHGLSTHF